MKRPKRRHAVKPERVGTRAAARAPLSLAARVEALLGVARNRTWFFALLLVAGTIVVYLPVWHAGLIWDDCTSVVKNPLIRRADGLYEFWFSTQPVSYYPVTSSLLWLEWRVWGEGPLGYHLVNVLLHSINAVLLFRALKWLSVPGAGLAAALFAVHPVNVESVAWISEQKNTLAMLFCLLSVLCYLRFDGVSPTAPSVPGPVGGGQATAAHDRGRWYWLALGAFVLALLSKTSAAPLPFLLFGLAWWRHGQVQRRDIARSVPFFCASVSVGLISQWFETHRAIGADFVPTEGFWTRLAGAGYAAWFYLYKAILPIDLRPIYPRWKVDATQWYSWLPLLLVGLGAHACWRYRLSLSKGPTLSLGYFLTMLLPVLGFLDINFMMYSRVADRWQYFAIIGPISLAAAAMFPARGLTDKRRRWTIAFSGALLCVLGILTYGQCGIYGDPLTFWQTALAGNPDSSIAHNNLGTVLIERGRLDEAKAHFERVLAMDPEHAMAHYNLGGVLRQQGQVDEAQAQFERAVDIAPGNAEAQLNLAELQADKGQLAEATAHFQRALELEPENAEAHSAVGLALLRQGQLDQALSHLQRAVEIRPAFAEAHGNLARALSQKGELGAAIAQLERAIELEPDQPEGYNNLANLLRQQGRLAEAVAHYQKALELRPSYAMAHYNLGEALQQMGNLGDAVAQFQIALELRPDFAPARRALDRVSAAAHSASP
jgi:tetratricopeptide (TPR) repeat protein